MSARSMTLVFAGFISVVLIGAGTVSYGIKRAKQTEATVNVTDPAPPLSAADQHTVSLAAIRILKHAAEAQRDIGQDKTDQALTQVEKGLTLVRIIHKTLKPTTVTTTLAAGDERYQDNDEVWPQFVVIDNNLGVVNTIDEVPTTVGTSDKSGAEAAVGTVPEVADEEVVFDTVKLNLALAERSLTTARRELTAGNGVVAAEALAQLQDEGVLVTMASIDLPLVRAMDNLQAAQVELDEHHLAAARVLLEATVDALHSYELDAPAKISDDAKKLDGEIAAFAKKLTAAAGDDAHGKVVAWRKQLVALLHE